MKKMRNIIPTIVFLIFFVVAVVVLIICLIKNPNFWQANVAQVFALFLTLCIAFLATQLKNDVRKKKEHAEQILKKIQAIVNSDCFYNVSGQSEETRKKMTMTFRSLNNSIDLLKKYGKELGFKDESEYIEKEFKDYREFVSEYLNDIDYLIKSEITLKKYSENIDNKCDIIIWKIY